MVWLPGASVKCSAGKLLEEAHLWPVDRFITDDAYHDLKNFKGRLHQVSSDAGVKAAATKEKERNGCKYTVNRTEPYL